MLHVSPMTYIGEEKVNKQEEIWENGSVWWHLATCGVGDGARLSQTFSIGSVRSGSEERGVCIRLFRRR